jgi:tetratricopeptide (TPR) repeat protein
MQYAFVADHFQYLAGPALIALVVAVVARLLRRLGPQLVAVPYVASGVVLVALAVLTVRQAGIYEGQLALWKDTVEKSPNSWMPHYNYGISLARLAGELDAEQPQNASQVRDLALEQFAQTTRIRPSHDRAWTQAGVVLIEKKKPQEAIPMFDRALQENPGSVDAMRGRAWALQEMKQYDAALDWYHKALAYALEHREEVGRVTAAELYDGIGKVLEAKGDDAAALGSYAQAVQLMPDVIGFHFDLAQALTKVGKRAPAAEEYAQIIRAQPDNIDARLALANLMMDVNNLNRAQQQLIAAARINPTDPKLMESAKRYDAEVRKAEAATRPATTGSATTRSATQASTGPATRAATNPTSEEISAPTTRPSK